MKYVTYCRVSTDKQGRSGLGLDAQRHTVMQYTSNGNVLAEFVEIESGSRKKIARRPKLAAALALAKREGATLVIAKLDRLSRDAAFILELKNAGVSFVACDMPEANTLTIGIMAVMAQHEREVISSRTAAAGQARKRKTLQIIAASLLTEDIYHPAVLAAYRAECQRKAAKGGLIDNVLPGARAKSIEAKRAEAANCPEWQRAAAFAKSLRGAGKSLRAIAAELNANNYTTREGKQFAAATVSRLFTR